MFVAMLLIGCRQEQAAAPSGKIHLKSKTPVTKTKIVKLTRSPEDLQKNNKKETPKTTETPEKETAVPPCCKSSQVSFKDLDVHGKLQGFDVGLVSNQEYEGRLMIEGDAEGVSEYQLRVRASMKGMHHEIDFPTQKVSHQEYKINPVIFTVPGQWNLSVAFVNENYEAVDECVCSAQVIK